MRTTIDMPDALYRKTALRGSSVKDLIVRAVEREVSEVAAPKSKRTPLKLPLIRSWKGPKLDLTGFDFDELLG